MTRAITLLGLLAVMAGCGPDPGPPDAALQWTEVADNYAPGALLSIWSNGPDNVWVVGGEPGSAVVRSYDGSGWTAHDTGLSQGLRWVHGFDSGELFVVGDGGAISMHSDGVWTPMDSGSPGATFWGVWGSAPDDVYAVGGPYFQAPSGVCANNDIPDCSLDETQLAATSSDEAGEETGDGEAPESGEEGSDGEAPESGEETGEEEPEAKSCHAPSSCDDDDPCTEDVCVGGVAFEKDVVVHYDGSTWSRVTLPDQSSPTSGQLYKVWGSGPDDVFIVGSEARSLHGSADAWEWVDAGVGVPLWTVAGTDADTVYAVGGLFNNATLIQWDGAAWDVVALPEEQPSMLQGLWVDTDGTVYIAGPNGYTATRSPAGDWVIGDVITALQYHAIFGDGAGGLYVAGGDISTAKSEHLGVLSTTASGVAPLP
jgi:hypothetical protein